MLGTTNSVIPSVQVGAGIPLQSTSAVGYPSAIPQPSLLPVQGGAIAQIVFGAFCIGRIFWVPLLLIINYNFYKGYLSGKITYDTEKYDKLINVPGYKAAESYLGASIKAYDEKRGFVYAYLTPNGNVRAVLAMILFAAAGALFIAAGIIGYKRASKLHKYLASINVKK